MIVNVYKDRHGLCATYGTSSIRNTYGASVMIFGKLPPESGIGARSRFFIKFREVTVAGARATHS